MEIIEGIAQIALTVRNLPKAVAFYRDILKLRHLFDAPNMSFFDLAGTRLLLSAQGAEPGGRGTLIYLKVSDATSVYESLTKEGAVFEQAPHIIGRTPTNEIWLAWCADPDGNLLGLMSEKTVH
jgi:predicted enzyme related to lactoylglutathione lyase